MQLWSHQVRLITDTRAALASGKRRILNVLPTGGGKGTAAAEISRLVVARGGKALFIVHRREIILDQANRLRNLGLEVGVILPGHGMSPYADVQVASTCTLLNRMTRLPTATLINIDEAHHYAKNSWADLVAAYPSTPIVGWTATPERGDGKPLNEFDIMIEGAKYSELIAARLIVPCRVYQPKEHMGSNLATDPVTAYHHYADGTKGFCFVPTLELAYEVATRFNDHNVPAVVVDGKTKKRVRDQALEQLRDGTLRMIVNYGTMTEGVDVASAETCILARRCHHTGTYLQCVGRVLRSSPDKTHGVLLDLVGASIKHGLPHVDREYSLEGKAFDNSKLPPLKTCEECGYTQLCGRTECEACGWQFAKREKRVAEIFQEKLTEVKERPQ